MSGASSTQSFKTFARVSRPPRNLVITLRHGRCSTHAILEFRNCGPASFLLRYTRNLRSNGSGLQPAWLLRSPLANEYTILWRLMAGAVLSVGRLKPATLHRPSSVDLISMEGLI